MSNRITKIDHEDQSSRAALQAEQQLFSHYGLDYKVHFLEMSNPQLRIRVLEVGEGKPLLMVPGGTGDAAFFAPLMAELRGFRMIALNRPGGGMSDGIDHRQVDVRQLAVDTIKLVADSFDLDSVPVIANSMGGLWALWYAQAFPERVESMVQIGCPALLMDTSAPFFMRLLGVPFINNFIAPNMQPSNIATANDGLRFQGSYQEDIDRMPAVGAEAAYHFFHLPTYLASWKSLVGAVATLTGANPIYKFGAEQLKHIRLPVRFIWGDNDPFGSLEVGHQAVDILPDARLHEMHCGHLPHLDKPTETGKVVRDFLEGIRSEAASVKTKQPILTR